ncbi:MAG: DPP IV N-terminal domain-containing protein, partial [Cyclonatronaceae bacterium]
MPQQNDAPPYRGLDTLQLKTIFAEPYLHGLRPSLTGFGPQSQRLFFSWNDSSYSETGPYVTPIDDAEGIAAEAISEQEARLPAASVSPDNSQLAYTFEGDLYLSDADGTNARILFAGKHERVSGTPLWSPDGSQIAFMYRGDIWSLNLRSTAVRQLTQKESDEPFYRLLAWGENGATIITNQVDQSEYLEVLFPEYVPKMVEAGKRLRGQPQVHVKVISLDDGFQNWPDEALADSSRQNDEAPDAITLLEGPYYIFNYDVSHDGRYFLLDYTGHDMKERELIVKDLARGGENTIHREETDGWLYFSLLRAEFAPNSQQLFFTSERSGFSHIYTARADGSRFRKLTEGDFEVDWATWAGSNSIIYSASERDPGLRDVYLANTNTGTTRRLTQSEAFRYDYALSRDNRYLAYLRT